MRLVRNARRRQRRSNRLLDLRTLQVADYLEDRLCLAAIEFVGTSVVFSAAAGVANDLSLSLEGDTYTFLDTVDKIESVINRPKACKVAGASSGGPIKPVTLECSNAAISSIVINLGDSDDSFTLVSTRDAITVLGGAGDDMTTLADVARVIAPVVVDGGGGTNRLTLFDPADTTADHVTLTSSSVGASPTDTYFGGGGSLSSFVNISDLTIHAGAGADQFRVLGTHTGSTTINGGGGNDVVLLGTAGASFDVLQGPVSIAGGGGQDRLEINDWAETEPHQYHITNTSVVRGVGPTAVGISFLELEQLSVATGDFSDEVTIDASGPGFPAALNVSTGGGDDAITVNLGNPTASTLIALDGGDEDDSLSINGGVAADSITLNGQIVAGSTIIQITGLQQFTVAGGDGPDFIDASDFKASLTIFGGLGDDEIKSGDGDDIIFGGGGNDIVNAGAGNDLINSGDGNDIIFGGGGNDVVNAGEGDDDVNTGDGNDIIFGGGGNDIVNGGAGNDLINSGDGNDIIFGGGGNDVVNAGAGDDNINGGDGNDIIFGGGGNDVVNGGNGDDNINAGDGNDIIFGGGGNDTINGGGGNDLINAGDGNDIIFGGGGNDMVNGGSGNDLINAGDGNDIIFGGGGNDMVNGGSGNDLINAGDGNDIIFGGTGDDTIIANDGDDIIFGGSGDDVLEGGLGNDLYIFTGDDLGQDVVIEAADVDQDTLDFSGLAGPVNLDLASLGLQQVSPGILSLTFSHPPEDLRTEFAGVEHVIGTEFADQILGNSRDNRLLGADFLTMTPTPPPVVNPSATQWVLLEFDAPDAGEHFYTPPERDEIQARIAADYSAFNFAFTQDRLAIPTSEYATLYFNRQGTLGEVGQASELDFRNLNLGGEASIDVNIILGGPEQPAATSENFVAMSATVGAHELGHLVGLRHIDSFGPIGFGIHTPPGSESFRPAYSGPDNAFETVFHMMATPVSVGSTLDDAVGDPYFGERSALKLAFSEYGTVIPESSVAPGDHASFATAQPISLAGLYVPNTLASGINSSKQFAAEAVAVTGSIGIAANGRSENDVYAFTGRAGDVVTVELFSDSLTRITTEIDSVVRVYDSAGKLLSFATGFAENDDSFEPTDSVIIDLPLPEDGTYFVEVDTFTFVGSEDFAFYCGVGGQFEGSHACFDTDIGDYELFVYRFDAGNATDGGDVLAGLSGHDTIMGGPGDDRLDGGSGNDLMNGDLGNDTYVIVPGSADVVVDRHDETGGIDTLDFSGASAAITIDMGIDNGVPQHVDSLGNTVALNGLFENLLGSGFADTIWGNAQDNVLTGGTGADWIDGRAGVDQIFEVRDADMTLSNGQLKIGSEGTDLLVNIESARLVGGVSNNKLNASAFTGTATLIGMDGNDDLQSGSGTGILFGGPGNDKLNGGNASDILIGGDGDDDIVGGSGRDLIVGGRGADRLVGGADDDLLIAGWTIYDEIDLALMQIADEWQSSRDYLDRVDRLQTGIDADDSLPFELLTLNTSSIAGTDTVFDDVAVDTLTGSSDRDWFLSNAGDITDRKPDEQLDT